MPSAARSIRAVALVREFVADESSGQRRPRTGSLGALEPAHALAVVQGTALAWAMGNLPGTRLFLVGGSLVATR